MPLWFLGVRRGGQALLIASPLLVAVISLAYLPVSQRVVGTFVIAYIAQTVDVAMDLFYVNVKKQQIYLSIAGTACLLAGVRYFSNHAIR